MRIFVDKQNRFIETFNQNNGFYMRTGILDRSGKDTGVDPFMRCYPGLLDIGIMGSCIHASRCTVGCYQGGTGNQKPNMSLDNYKKIIDQVKDKLFQVALGGHGDPNKHENFREILKYSRDNGVVPNYTTSGFDLTDEEVATTKEFCGAVAVSWYRQDYTYQAINKFIVAGAKTNIHYVLSNSSIDEAIERLQNNGFVLSGVNAVIFLLHKPVGCGSADEMLKADDPRVAKFFKLVDGGEFPHKVGFDSCTVPGIINYTEKINKASVDTCEGGRFSAYVTPDMYMLPCSFDSQWRKWAVSLNDFTVEQAWNSPQFDMFRNSMKSSCPNCTERVHCMGGCPIIRDIVLCKREERVICESKV
jgi:radical SAM protein with 4Fe4S-binding SPASM domain